MSRARPNRSWKGIRAHRLYKTCLLYTSRIARESGRLDQLARTLEALNPGGVLERGYALITADGRALTQAGELRPDQQIGIRMKGGSALARVLSVEEERAHGGQKKAEL